MSRKICSSHALHYHAGKFTTSGTDVIAEFPVTLSVNGKVLLTFMCTPKDLDALAVGFLYNEGMIQSATEIEVIEVCPTGENVDIWTKNNVDTPEHWRRTTGCTGGASGVDLTQLRPELKDSILLTPAQVDSLVNDLLDAQVLYRQIGGVHTSILSNGSHVLASAEDVGRHNTLDKIAGRCLLDHIKAKRKILVTTGRISSDMIQKAAMIGASVVISRTSPTSLSVSLADKWGITLIGYARHDQFIIYTHPQRVVQPPIIPVTAPHEEVTPSV